MAASCTAQPELRIIENGGSNYNIVVPDNPTKAESRAAEVLQTYLQTMTDVTLPIIRESDALGSPSIYLGKVRSGKPSEIRMDGFEIATDLEHVYIWGNSGKGTLYGVYTFLEQYLGCRKYAGGEPAFVPRKKTLSLRSGLRDVQNPVFVFRQSYYPSSEDSEYLDWHKLHRFEDLWGVWGHSFFKILPPKRHFSAHPEYYSLIKGKRQPIQLCLTNEQVFLATVDYIRKESVKKPDAIYWSISPNDEPLYCTCESCKTVDAEEGGPQGSLIRFVNRIAGVFPEFQFTTLAYAHTINPPKKTRPAKNVIVILSSIEAQRTKPLDEEPTAKRFRDNLSGWSAVTSRLFVWDYTTQYTNYLTPFPDYRNAARNLRYFARKGVNGVFFHGSEEHYSDMAEWNSYLQAKLLWNPDIDDRLVWKDFMQGYYGAAGEVVTSYLDELYEAVESTQAKLDIYGNPINHYRDYLSPKRIDRYSSYLDSAEVLLEQDSLRYNRVVRLRLPLEYVVLQQARFFGTEKYGYLVENDEGVYEVRNGWERRLARFAADAKKAGVTLLSEGGVSPDEYVRIWKQQLSRPWKFNKAKDADIELGHPYATEYSAKGPETLTDGLEGQPDYSYNWLLFYGSDLVATFDFWENVAINSVTIGFLDDPRHFIFLPEQIKIEVSDDGRDFRVLRSEEIGGSSEHRDVNIPRYTMSMPVGTKARYMRITATCPTELPGWRYHESKKPAIACDEIRVD